MQGRRTFNEGACLKLPCAPLRILMRYLSFEYFTKIAATVAYRWALYAASPGIFWILGWKRYWGHRLTDTDCWNIIFILFGMRLLSQAIGNRLGGGWEDILIWWKECMGPKRLRNTHRSSALCKKKKMPNKLRNLMLVFYNHNKTNIYEGRPISNICNRIKYVFDNIK